MVMVAVRMTEFLSVLFWMVLRATANIFFSLKQRRNEQKAWLLFSCCESVKHRKTLSVPRKPQSAKKSVDESDTKSHYSGNRKTLRIFPPISLTRIILLKQYLYKTLLSKNTVKHSLGKNHIQVY